MSKKRRLVRAIKKFYQKFIRKSSSTVRKQSLWLLRSFIVTKKRRNSVNSGFVLPTVAMVSLVVVLLTIAILFRSFERSKNASNVRVNQVVLNAAMPAIDRAKAKIDTLFNDPTLPRSTPSDASLYTALTKGEKLAGYTFGDETPLAVRYDIDGKGGIKADTELEKSEVSNTAWRFPVDTDNNGKYDSFTLYGFYFRSPTRGSDGKFDRTRTPLDARTPPMDDGSLGGICEGAKGTSSSLVGDSGWYKSGGNLKKSFFVYVATVAITDKNASSTYGNKYESFKGNQGFSAVEFQQDQERIPMINNAVVYEDDLEITPGAGLELNGRIFTNSNFFTGTIYDPIRFYQVSSPNSCFYEAEFSKVIVGGNLGYGRIFGSKYNNNKNKYVEVDLYKRGTEGEPIRITPNDDVSVNDISKNTKHIAYNAEAYALRINLQVEKALAVSTKLDDYTKDPDEVQERIKARIADSSTKKVEDIRREELEAYFKKRTRKVPFADPNQKPTAVTLRGLGTNKLRGPDKWIYPFSLNNNNQAGYTGLTLNLGRLRATEPKKLKEFYKESEQYLGDRILIGNNLPALWFDTNTQDFVGSKTPQPVLPQQDGDNDSKKSSTEWTDYDDDENKFRSRTTKIEQLVSLEGATKRNDFFEQKATEKPKNPLDNVGGMRVVTGAGIYVDDIKYKRADSVLPAPNWDKNFVDTANRDENRVWVNSLKFGTLPPIITWSDSTSMGDPNDTASKGDLLMRATAVYHYKNNDGADQTPIACVSSYYDPTNSTTAQNNKDVDNKWKNPDAIAGNDGKSNNGIVYPSYGGSRTGVISTYRTQLENQARLVFPNGRFVNEPLRNAMLQRRAGKTLSMADNSAIDAAVCAIRILNGSTPNDSKIPHGTIYETSFLDARQVKSVEKTPNIASKDPEYKASLEQRQPLEVRVTVLDLDKLRQEKIGGTSPAQEYLLPNSGIIYATRDDALLDMSVKPGNSQNIEKQQKKNIDQRKLISPTDYKLDPTRRPNGIMLINGKRLDRERKYRDEEKGLILATNVPAYIKGDFNLHVKGGDPKNKITSGMELLEEFEQELRDEKTGEINWTDFYKRADLDKNFACRINDPRLPECKDGDSWRPATVLADAVTVLSDNFRFGFRNEGDYDLRNNAGNAVVSNYDFNNNGDATDNLNEKSLKVDLNGDGDKDDTSVSEANEISVSAVRRKLGFFENNFLTSANWFETSGNIDSVTKDFQPTVAGNQEGSSYVNNFVTPIQRRVLFGEYVMEVCQKVPVETCQPQDWVILLDEDNNPATPSKTPTITKANQLEVATSATSTSGTKANLLVSGTTAEITSNPENQSFARRVAFLRNTNNKLVLDQNGYPVPLGINKSGRVTYYPYNDLTIPFENNAFTPDAKPDVSGNPPPTQKFDAFKYNDENRRPRIVQKALWFRTVTANESNFTNGETKKINYGYQHPLYFLKKLTKNSAFKPPVSNYKEGDVEQPLLVPVLQIHMPNDKWTKASGNPGATTKDNKLPGSKDRGVAKQRNWLQIATKTTTNLAIVGGDTPAHETETNGGLENFVRYLEQWLEVENNKETKVNHNLSGSLIQYKRSAYATAPWQVIRSGENGIFGSTYPKVYATSTTGGKTPFYTPPSRQWGFDVGLLSQIPDLFAQTFTLPPTREPNEFFREVNRDDEWVKALLCAKTVKVNNTGITINQNDNAVPDSQRPTEFCKEKTGDK